MRKPSFWFLTWSDINQAVRPHNMARGLKFHIQEEDELCYQYSENKGADQLRGYREADLRLCFRICKKPVFSLCGSYVSPQLRLLLAHLSRRLIGELIVYQLSGVRRPSASVVVHNAQTSSSQKRLG